MRLGWSSQGRPFLRIDQPHTTPRPGSPAPWHRIVVGPGLAGVVGVLFEQGVHEAVEADAEAQARDAIDLGLLFS
jgi:hypothetical protein